MKYFTKDEFREKLIDVGVVSGDILFVHSSLLSIGLLKGVQIDRIPEEILDVILDVLGPEGTLAVPSFTFEFCKGVPFSKTDTPSSGMGVFSEVVRTHPESVRSSHPTQSIAAIGADSVELCKADTKSAFAAGGCFEKMITMNGKILFLGAGIQSTALIHYVEEKLKVPYRFWKNFTGRYIDADAGVDEQRTYKMYVRNLKLNPILELQPVEDRLNNQNQCNIANIGMGEIKLIKATDFVDTAQDLLENDPYSLLKNRIEIRKNGNTDG